MGCDIHAFIEYREKEKNWQGFSYKDINLGRNYGIFACMAGVRDYWDSDYIEPRGMPEDVSMWSRGEFLLYISKNLKDEHYSDDGKSISVERAEEFIKEGYATRVGDNHITDSDIHSISWLTASEFEKCLQTKDLEFDPKKSPDYSAALVLLKHFESLGLESRIVFGFDN